MATGRGGATQLPWWHISSSSSPHITCRPGRWWQHDCSSVPRCQLDAAAAAASDARCRWLGGRWRQFVGGRQRVVEEDPFTATSVPLAAAETRLTHTHTRQWQSILTGIVTSVLSPTCSFWVSDIVFNDLLSPG